MALSDWGRKSIGHHCTCKGEEGMFSHMMVLISQNNRGLQLEGQLRFFRSGTKKGVAFCNGQQMNVTRREIKKVPCDPKSGLLHEEQNRMKQSHEELTAGLGIPPLVIAIVKFKSFETRVVKLISLKIFFIEPTPVFNRMLCVTRGFKKEKYSGLQRQLVV